MSLPVSNKLSKFSWLLSGLYLGLGIFLFFILPELHTINSFTYDDWYSQNPNILVKVYHLPNVIWLGMGTVFGAITLWFNAKDFSRKSKLLLTGISAVLWLIFLAHAIDLLSSFLFCHEWGCSGGFLPTWRWLGLLGK